MGIFHLYSRALDLLGPDRRLGWGLAFANVALACALFAEVLCPLAIMAGVWTRLACLPLLFLLLVSMLLVHADWTLEQGQFGWLLIILFSTIALTGPGRFVVFPAKKGQGV